MDLSHPIRSVIPSAHGNVLAILARSGRPLSGRGVAALADGQLSPKGVNLVLRSLVAAGIVLVDDHPPAKLYQLNRRHLAADAIVALAELRPRLIEHMRTALASWEPSSAGAWLFGSAARGDGDADSDIDVLILRSEDLDADDPTWLAQLDRFTDDVTAWSGNPCSVVEHSEDSLDELMASDERLARDLRSEAVALTDRKLPLPTPRRNT